MTESEISLSPQTRNPAGREITYLAICLIVFTALMHGWFVWSHARASVAFSGYPLANVCKSLFFTILVLMMVFLGRRWLEMPQLGLGVPQAGRARWTTIVFLLVIVVSWLVFCLEPGWLIQIKYNANGTLASGQRTIPAWMQGMNYHLPMGSFLLVLISGAILIPVYEEILFRAIIFQFLKNRWGFQRALWLTGFFFLVAHDLWGAFGQSTSYGINQVMKVLLVNFGCCYLLEKTRSLYPSMLLHGSANLQVYLIRFSDLT